MINSLYFIIIEGISKPTGVATDSKGRIIVVDYNHHLVIF